ncbi:MAG: tRNA (adenosine(37)-N6)-dimethylallyltransferase MiaA [Deltaproteobacteria bacterium]|nr:MAG: tRNA (adenosine(37)-N6)-dimethylallyltransferase MiaA [Deltaproteobacteria bacterium]
MVVVTGPTAAGKSAVAMELALRFGGEIVNADSMQVYRYLDIGTAKPSLADRTRVPHHVIDVVHPRQGYSAGRYLEDARAAARGVHERGRVVFLTGGTGLYIRAFLHGLLGAGGAEPELRAALEAADREARDAGDPARLHRRLAGLDPETARRIHPNDTRRLVRALELAVHWGTPASRLHAAHRFAEQPYRVLHLALDPGTEPLDRRIDARCAQMIERGLLQEVRALRRRGVGPDARCMQAIGYRHMAPVVDGRDTLANAAEAMQRDTRRFARRQRTWLRSVSDLTVLHPDDADAIAGAVAAFLGGCPLERAAEAQYAGSDV